jgi:hypothetical protein
MNLLAPIAKMICNIEIERNNLWTTTDTIPEVDEEQKNRFF